MRAVDAHDSSGASDGLGWLCPTDGHRARMLDMGPRVGTARTTAAVAVGVGMLATIGELGWWTFVLFGVAIVNLLTVERRIARARRPERVVAGSVLLTIILTGASAAATGGGTSPVLALIVIPVAVAAARFRAQVVWAAAAVAALVAIMASSIAGPEQAVRHPLTLVGVFVLLVAVTAATTALMDAEFQFRGASVFDPLTGLLNRSGLEARFLEVSAQARLMGRPVCLVMCDLDQFKRVNDEHGHERGDAVLREVSNELRRSLRSFELLYRLGGEEFLVLLPGVDLHTGVEIADVMRAAVQVGRPGGLSVTASFGVSVARGEDIDFVRLYRSADNALYRAKRTGRNRVFASDLSIASSDEILAGTSPSARSMARQPARLAPLEAAD